MNEKRSFLSRSKPHWGKSNKESNSPIIPPSPISNLSESNAYNLPSTTSNNNIKKSISELTTKTTTGPSSNLLKSSSVEVGNNSELIGIRNVRNNNNLIIQLEGEESNILALIKKIITKLPIHSNSISISTQQQQEEENLKENYRVLYEYSEKKVSTVIGLLAFEVDTLTKPPFYNPETDFVSVDLLRSQLSLLNTIVNSTIHHWVSHDTSEKRRRRNYTQTDEGSDSKSSTPQNFIDPLPLDESIAKQLASICTFFLKQHNLQDEVTMNASSSSSSSNSSSASISCLTQSTLRLAQSGVFPLLGDTSKSFLTRQAVTNEIYRLACRILYFLSASNWNIVFGKVKARIGVYANPNGSVSSSSSGSKNSMGGEDSDDLGDMRVLEWCCLDRKRLSTVIQELCNTFIHLKRPAQASLSIILRRSIWSWIESFSSEFSSLTASGPFIIGESQSSRKLEGGPEILFDIIYSISESSKRKTFVWPVMGMLLVICPGFLEKVVVGEGGRSATLTKKVQFLEGLRKALKGNKMADVAVVCYSDLCRAAAFTRPNTSDPSALRLLVADLDSELKAKLFDPIRPFLNAEGLPEITLTTEALVSLYRLDPFSVLRNTFPSLLASNASESAHLIAVGACMILLNEDQQSPWFPSIDPLLSIVTQPIRQLFLNLTITLAQNLQSQESSSTGGTPSLASTTNRRGSTKISPRYLAPTTEESPDIVLIAFILKIWASDLRFLSHRNGDWTEEAEKRGGREIDESEEEDDGYEKILLAIVQLLGEKNERGLRSCATDLLLALNRSEVEEVGMARDGAFETLALEVSYGICRHALDWTEDRKALELLIQDLMRYQAFFQGASTEQAKTLLDQEGWAGHWASLEFTLLLSMTSFDSESRNLAILSFQRMSIIMDEMEKVHGTDGIGRGSDSNTKVLVEAFAKEFSETESTGLESDLQQKLIRKVLNSLKNPTVGLLVAWDEAMRRWKDLSAVVFSRVMDNESEHSSDVMRRDGIEARATPEEQFEAWGILSGFLLAASGACSVAVDSSRLDAIVPSRYFPSRFFRPLDRIKHTDRLIQELVDLLVCDSIKVRDVVKNSLGSDLSEIQYPLFFKHLKSIVGHFFDNEKGVPVTEEAFTVFIDMTISVLRLMFDRLSTHLDATANLTVDSLLLSFTIYIQRLGYSLQAYRLKIRLCQLFETVFNQRGSISQDSEFRNKLVEYLISWASATRPSFDEGADRLPRDLDLACLKAMVPLFDGLVVHKAESSSENVTDSIIFNRYFEFFALDLKRQGDTTESHKTQVKVESQTDRHWNARNSSQSRESAVKALANLISANIDPAHQHLAHMGLEKDISVRGAYLDCLVEVIDKGTRFELLPKVSVSNTFDKIIALIREPDLILAMALSEVCSAANFEDLTEIFLKIFDTPKSVARFFKAIIEMEVSVTDHESTLFRGNSFATRILTSHARAKGYHYLRNTLKDLLLTLCMKPNEFSVDFDPHRQTASDDAASRNLEQVTEAFLVCISQSVEQIPPSIREVCHHIGEIVGARFPESVFTAIGGFIFLRFINPAIVSPENIDLDLPAENRDIRRGLVMITKVLQALANNVRFGAKEPGMSKLNDFMDVNIFGMTRFLQAISHHDNTEDSIESNHHSAQPLDESEKTYLHQFLVENLERIGFEILEGKHSNANNDSDLVHTTSQQTWDSLSSLVAELGPSLESECRLSVSEWENSPQESYNNFMVANESRITTNSQTWSNVFFETIGNKSGNLTFCIVLRRLDIETADIESLLCYIFQQLAKVQTSFEILVDCTQFSKENEVPVQFILQLTTLLPAKSLQGFARMIIYAPNSNFKRYLRKLNRFISFDRMDSRKVEAVATVAELESLFMTSETTIVKSTLSLGRENRTVFQNITEHHDVRVEHPVVLRIGKHTLVVATAKKQDLFADVKCVLEDMIELSEIELIKKVTVGEDGEGISILLSGESTSRVFLAARRDEVFMALNVARDASPQPKILSRNLLPQNATAVLVNTILFNLCSRQSSIRSSAYELLASLARSQNIAGFEDLSNSKGILVPSGHLSFLSNVSERLAIALPGDSLAVVEQFALGLPISSEGALYIYLIRPWIYNLSSLVNTSREDREEVQTKLRRIIRQLMFISIREPAIHMIMLNRIWQAIGKIDFLIPLILDEAVTLVSATEPGIETEYTERVGEILLALSSPVLLRGKLLARLRNVIASTAHNPVSSLSYSPQWSEITALIRLDLPLSFDAHITAQLFLPDIFQICISLVATGTLAVRRMIKDSVVNTVHSLLREGALHQEALLTLLMSLNGSQASELFDFPTLSLDETREAWDLAEAGDLLVEILVEVMEVGSPSLDTANMWRTRWASLATASCFQYNPALQPRAFVVLGALASEETDLDLMFQLLAQLRTCIYRSKSDDIDGDLQTIVILKCIARHIPGLAIDPQQDNSTFLATTFFSGLAILQSASPEISPHAINLLQIVIGGLRSKNFFSDRDRVEDVVFDLRDLEETDLKIDDDLLSLSAEWIAGCIEYSEDKNRIESFFD